MAKNNTLIPDDDRQRGILTPADRRFLRGKKELSSEQSRRDARYRIRQRLKNAFLDFSILFSNLDRRDRGQIFEPVEEFQNGLDESLNGAIDRNRLSEIMEDVMVSRGISDCMAFIRLGIGDANQSFETMLETAVSEAEEERGYVVDNVEVEITVKRGKADIKDIYERFENGEPLTESEMSTLLRSDEFELNQESLEDFLERLSETVSEELGSENVEIDVRSDEE